MLIDTDIPFLQISWKVIIGAVVTTTLFFVFALGLAFKAFRKKPTTGKEGLVGEQGIALTDLNPEGSVEVHGEIWNAHAENRVEKGQKIIVEQVDQHHLRLTVKQSK